MIFRQYKKEYESRLIEIFKSNCPKYFDAKDEVDFIDFLEKYTDENYLVVFRDNEIIGCGGHYTKDTAHGIAWVMFERNSIGSKQLLNVCDAFFSEILNRILEEGKGFDIYINTTQLLEKLFNRYGFKTFQIIEDGFGDGLNELKMKKTNKKSLNLH